MKQILLIFNIFTFFYSFGQYFGELDQTFPHNVSGTSVIEQTKNGAIIIGGSFRDILENDDRSFIGKINSDGTIDESFSSNEIGNTVNSIVVQPDNKILVGGHFYRNPNSYPNTQNYIARLNSDGSLDNTFNCELNGSVDEICLQPDGKIIVATNSTQNNVHAISRFNVDGSLDEEFNSNILSLTEPGPQTHISAGRINSIVFTPDSMIFIGGSFQSHYYEQDYLLCLNYDGTLNTNFNSSAESGPNAPVLDLKLVNDSLLLVGGRFNEFYGSEVPKSVLINKKGKIKSDFENLTALTDIHSVAQIDNEFYILGSTRFSYDNKEIFGPVIINSSGDVIDITKFDQTNNYDTRVTDILYTSNRVFYFCGYITKDYSGIRVRDLLRIETPSNIKYWDGEAGDGLWHSATNWVGDIVPSASVKVYLDNSNVAGNYSVQIAADASVDYLEIDNANVDLNINQNISLSYDSISNHGSIVLEDGASLLPNNANTGFVTGNNFTIKRNRPAGLSASFYNFWSSPVNNGNSSMLVGGRNIYSLALGADDDNGHWQSFNGTMTNGRSYAATHVNQAVFTGTPNNGAISFAVKDNTASGDGNINMVGNPYPSAINAAEFVNDNAGILQDATLHLWAQVANNTKNVASNFVAVNNTGPSHPGQRNQTLANTDIASCQGFQVLVAANGNINFENDQRNGNNSGFKSGTDRTLKKAQKIWMAVEQDSTDVHTLVAFGEQATQGIDFYYDAHDNLSTTQLQINSINKGRHFKINALPLSVEDYMVPLSVTVGKGDFSLYCSDTLNFSKYQSVFLRDRETNQQFKLSKGEKIHFSNTEANSWQNRFYLMFLEKSTSITDAEALNNLVHYQVSQEGLILNSLYNENLEVRIVNSLGQQLGEYELDANGQLNLDLKQGFYILHISNSSYSSTIKIKL